MRTCRFLAEWVHYDYLYQAFLNAALIILGASDLTIMANAVVEGIPVTQSAVARLNVVAATTSFIGRTVVDDALQTSLSGVTVTMLGKDGNGGVTGCTGSTRSDAAGNFALQNLPASCIGPQLVGFDGTTATSPAGKYAGVNLLYTFVSGQVTVSPVLVHLPRIDNKETFFVQQNASQDQTYAFKYPWLIRDGLRRHHLYNAGQFKTESLPFGGYTGARGSFAGR